MTNTMSKRLKALWGLWRDPTTGQNQRRLLGEGCRRAGSAVEMAGRAFQVGEAHLEGITNNES